MDVNEIFTPTNLLPGHGTHLLGEWYGCDFSGPAMHDAQMLRKICLGATNTSGLQVVGDAFHQFTPHGVTGTVLLAESHLAIHTWPEARFVTVDVYVCNYLEDNTHKALELYGALIAHFQPAQENFAKVLRGRLPEHIARNQTRRISPSDTTVAFDHFAKET